MSYSAIDLGNGEQVQYSASVGTLMYTEDTITLFPCTSLESGDEGIAHWDFHEKEWVFYSIKGDNNMADVDMVNHPPHYTSHPSGIECIQITEHMGFNLGNALKYIWRSDLKNDTIEDLRKAKFYIDREIAKRLKDE